MPIKRTPRVRALTSIKAHFSTLCRAMRLKTKGVCLEHELDILQGKAWMANTLGAITNAEAYELRFIINYMRAGYIPTWIKAVRMFKCLKGRWKL